MTNDAAALVSAQAGSLAELMRGIGRAARAAAETLALAGPE